VRGRSRGSECSRVRRSCRRPFLTLLRQSLSIAISHAERVGGGGSGAPAPGTAQDETLLALGAMLFQIVHGSTLMQPPAQGVATWRCD
jgi:hypothetical protein